MYSDVIRKQRQQLEDRFIDQCERAINQGLTFDQAFKPGEGATLDFRLSPEWKQQYEEMEAKAAPFRQLRKPWSADGVRKEIADLRKAEKQHEEDEQFYKDNLFEMRGLIQAGKSFSETGLPQIMKPFYERAQKETLGYVPEEKTPPAHNPFLTGFSLGSLDIKTGG